MIMALFSLLFAIDPDTMFEKIWFFTGTSYLRRECEMCKLSQVL